MQTQIITNIAVTSTDEWAMLAPYGKFQGFTRKPEDQSQLDQQVVQQIDRGAAQKLADKFNSLTARIGRFFKGCFIYNGHADVDGGKDTSPKGMITALEARDDGLYAKPVFDDAAKVILNGADKFFSAAWLSEPVSMADPLTFTPVELVSVAITERPNLPVTILNEDPAIPFPTPAEPTPQAQPQDLQQQLDTANARVELLDNMVTAANAQIEQQQQQIADLTTEISALKSERAKSVIAQAVAEQKLTLAEAADWVDRLTADYTSGCAMIANMKPKLPVIANTADMGSRKTTTPSGGQIQKFHDLVAEKRKAKPDMDYRTACYEVTKEHPGIFGTTTQ